MRLLSRFLPMILGLLDCGASFSLAEPNPKNPATRLPIDGFDTADPCPEAVGGEVGAGCVDEPTYSRDIPNTKALRPSIQISE